MLLCNTKENHAEDNKHNLLPTRHNIFSGMQWVGFSLFLRLTLTTHYVFLERGRKGPQRTMHRKLDVIIQVNILLSPQRMFVHASFCFSLDLNLYVFPSQLTGTVSLLILHTIIP